MAIGLMFVCAMLNHCSLRLSAAVGTGSIW
jgi:hypothetical protein